MAFPFIAALPALILTLGTPVLAFAQDAGGTPPPAPASAATNAGNPSPSDQTDEERQKLFQQFFGKTKKPQGDKHLDVPIILDAQPIGLVPAILPEDIAGARLSAKGLQDTLNSVLVDSVLTKIAQAKSEDGYVPLAALRDAGLGAKMDALTLALSLDVPGDLRKPQLIDLKGHGAPPVTGSGAEIKPALLSSYVNVHGDLDYIHDGTTPGLQPLNLALDGALNFDGQVLQSTGTYVQSGQRRWQRGDTRLVHDDPENANRYQLGDLLFPLAGFQTSQPLGGFSLARDYTLQPYTSIQPAGQQQFILTSPSKVEVDVNGHPAQVIRLPPGRYDIRNFPFAQGANDVQLQVTDASGRTSTTNIPFFFNSNLLDVGVSEFDYSIGLPLVTNNGLRKYPLTFPSYSMFHNYGFSDAITAGANLQGNENQAMAGLELGTATRIGDLDFDVAGSRVRGYGLDYSARVQHSFADASAAGSGKSLISSITFTGNRFATLGTTSPSNGTRLDLSTRYSQPLVYEVYGGIGGSYDFNRGNENSYNVDLSFRRTLTTNINANLDLIRSFDLAGKVDNRILLTLTVSFDSGHQFARAGYDSDLRAKTVDWEYIPAGDLYNPYGDLHLGNSTQSNTVNGDVSYNTTRFETTLSHAETYPLDASSGTTLDRRTSLIFGSALVYADGHVAAARPVGDSFALIATQKNAKGYDFKVDPQATTYTTRNDFLMPAVIPNLNSYQMRTTQIAIPDLPNGFDVGPETFVIEPTYRSGSLVTIGTDATVFLDGTLVGTGDKPLSLVSGTITEAGASKATPLTFFTNRTGRFRVEGLKPGTFKLEFAGSFPGISTEIKIPADASGIYHIGTIKLPIDQSD